MTSLLFFIYFENDDVSLNDQLWDPYPWNMKDILTCFLSLLGWPSQSTVLFASVAKVLYRLINNYNPKLKKVLINIKMKIILLSDMNEREAVDLLKLCVKEISTRFFINLPRFKVKCITKDGIKVLPDVTVEEVNKSKP